LTYPQASLASDVVIDGTIHDGIPSSMPPLCKATIAVELQVRHRGYRERYRERVTENYREVTERESYRELQCYREVTERERVTESYRELQRERERERERCSVVTLPGPE